MKHTLEQIIKERHLDDAALRYGSAAYFALRNDRLTDDDLEAVDAWLHDHYQNVYDQMIATNIMPTMRAWAELLDIEQLDELARDLMECE